MTNILFVCFYLQYSRHLSAQPLNTRVSADEGVLFLLHFAMLGSGLSYNSVRI